MNLLKILHCCKKLAQKLLKYKYMSTVTPSTTVMMLFKPSPDPSSTILLEHVEDEILSTTLQRHLKVTHYNGTEIGTI